MGKLDKIEPIVRTQDDKRQLYVLIYERLFDLIQEGYFQQGEKLPGETTLAKKFGVSRGTLRQALLILQEDGIIHNAQGKGNYVAKNHQILGQGLERLGSIARIFPRNEAVKIAEVKLHSETPNSMLREELQIDNSELILTLHRTYQIGDERVCHVISFLPHSRVLSYDLDLCQPDQILNFVDLDSYGIISTAQTRILMTRAGDFIASQLQVKEGEPLMLFEETQFLESGKPLAFSKGYFRSEHFAFHVNRR